MSNNPFFESIGKIILDGGKEKVEDKSTKDSIFITKPVTNFMQLQFLNQYLKSYDCCIAGGCFKNIFTGDKIKDIDIFFKDERAWADVVSQIRSDEAYKFYYENDKVISFKNTKTNIAIELIKIKYGEPEQLINDFDWTITKFSYFKVKVEDEFTDEMTLQSWHDEYKCLFHKDFFEHLMLHRLVADNNILFPINSFERALRYKGYGYSMCRETKEKLIVAIHDSNLDEDISKSLYDGMD